MADRLRVYVAGPLTQGDLQANIDRARSTGKRLIEAGFAPLVPHFSCFFDSNTPSAECGVPYETWMEISLALVAGCDALLRLSGFSPGADREVAYACRLAIPVYHDLEGLIAARNGVSHD